MNPDKYKGQRIAVLGCATSGIAAARLASRLGAEVTVLDSSESEVVKNRARELKAEGLRVLLGAAAMAKKQKFDLAVFSPGIDPSWPLARLMLERRVRSIGELEFAWQNCDKPCVAITGTNGKTTTTELIVRILVAAGVRTVAGANYGVALSELLLEGAPVDVYTLEVSSFQLELIETFRPKVAVWMNFAADHLDRHPDMDAYRRAKLRIFENQTSEDLAVLNGAESYPPLAARQETFSAYREDTDYHLRLGKIWHRNECLLDMAHTHLRGTHNAENLMAAMAAAHALGIPFKMMEDCVRDYRAPRHRCELVAIIKGREFINDSKATNLHAMESALRGQERPVVLIAGGKQKGLDYAPLRELVREKTTHVFTIGEIRDPLAECWADASRTTACSTLQDAVQRAYGAAGDGQTVLFSPGTSSFDMFTGYDQRGNAFCELVNQLLEK